MGLWDKAFLVFFLRMTWLSVLMTWIYNNNRRSILSVILLHFAYNLTFSFVHPIPETMHLYGTGLILIMATVIVTIWGPQTLTRWRGVSPRRPSEDSITC
jgi:membrane protease YdiL (CAAX protease family)